MAVVLDSDAVIGFLDRADALHAGADKAIREWAGKERLLTSALTYAEVLTGARLGHHDEEQVKGFFADLVSEILKIDIAIADAAAHLRARRRSLRMPDAMVLATAESHPEVGLILTGDEDVAKVPGLRCHVQLLR